MTAMRTSETEAKYTEEKRTPEFKNSCALCDDRAAVAEFTYWRMVPNKYPYDRVAKVHHMLVTKRHAPDAELTQEEWQEFQSIKTGYVREHYNFMIEPLPLRKSIPSHAHLHFILEKD